MLKWYVSAFQSLDFIPKDLRPWSRGQYLWFSKFLSGQMNEGVFHIIPADPSQMASGKKEREAG